MNGDWIIRNIVTLAGRFSPAARLNESELRKLDLPTLQSLWQVLRDAEEAIQREKRTYRPFPGGPKIRL